eukprot:GHVN01057582.1.p1 GENE.GHVN01057582.1~~GHVN01057582.1.p1  ORF type:complete len:370 (+),score=45.81 GHVN01057582.1:202-1311(+)
MGHGAKDGGKDGLKKDGAKKDGTYVTIEDVNYRYYVDRQGGDAYVEHVDDRNDDDEDVSNDEEETVRYLGGGEYAITRRAKETSDEPHETVHRYKIHVHDGDVTPEEAVKLCHQFRSQNQDDQRPKGSGERTKHQREQSRHHPMSHQHYHVHEPETFEVHIPARYAYIHDEPSVYVEESIPAPRPRRRVVREVHHYEEERPVETIVLREYRTVPQSTRNTYTTHLHHERGGSSTQWGLPCCKRERVEIRKESFPAPAPTMSYVPQPVSYVPPAPMSYVPPPQVPRGVYTQHSYVAPPQPTPPPPPLVFPHPEPTHTQSYYKAPPVITRAPPQYYKLGEEPPSPHPSPYQPYQSPDQTFYQPSHQLSYPL